MRSRHSREASSAVTSTYGCLLALSSESDRFCCVKSKVFPSYPARMASASIQAAFEKSILESAKLVEEQVNAEIERLEQLKDDDLEGIRQKRLEAMKKYEKKKIEWLQKGHGEYSELASEPEFFETCKKSEHVVVHFYRESSFRCKIVDKHLNILAQKHVETRFVKISVDRAPFLCERMKIRVLPTIVLFKDFKSKDYIVGFDDLGGTDDFTTEMLEWRIARGGIINYAGDLHTLPDQTKTEKRPAFTVQRKTIRGKGGDDDSDDD
ncbi:thioredoxin domain-containing protein 9-like [Ornithodoros turicata]|uniref:thioredoxin domain-containing protein 9-like n=1 Tax=Ornithodoros turicata TaxID=34597 RepID=UPI0031392930